MLLAFNSLIMKVISPSKHIESITTFSIVIASLLIDWRVESDMMIFCEWLVERVKKTGKGWKKIILMGFLCA